MKAGWVKRRLRDVTTKIGSGATPLGGEAAYKTAGISLIRSLNVHDWGFRMKDLAFIDDKQAEQLDNVVVETGDVLLNITGASVARCCIVPNEVLPSRVNQHVSILRPMKDKLLPKLLHYMLISKDYKDRLLSAGEGGGSTRQALTKTQLQDFLIEFPDSLPEQRRIVGILDEVFAGIASAKTNVEKNLDNAQALFESHLQAVFNQRNERWVEKQLGEIAEFKNGLNFSQNSRGQSVRVVGVGDFQSNSIVPMADLSSVTIDGDLNESYAIRKNDILTVRSNGSKELVGRCMLVPDLSGVVSYSGFIIRIRFDANSIDPKFLLHFMKCRATRDQLTREGGGANISNINQEKLSSLSVPMLALSTQQQQAEKLDRLQVETQSLESIYQRKLDALEALKKSLLHQAFNGDL